MSNQRSIPDSVRDVFTPPEHAVLARWLGLPPRCDDAPTFEAALAELDFPDAPDFAPGSSAVAGILLARLQEELPVFSHTRDGEIHTTRPPKPIPIQRALLPRPVFLFAIDWAMTGPGFSWPCHYNCAYVPGYNRVVVTASYDCDEVCGAADVALGCFGTDRDLAEGALEVIGRAWADEAAREGEAWDCFLAAGAVSQAQANALAARIWAPLAEEDEEWSDSNDDRDGEHL
jgi:hypothetical protein